MGTTGKILDSLRQDFSNNVLIGVPAPTTIHQKLLATERRWFSMGVPQKVKYYDAIEQLKKRSKEELSTEEALRQLDSPDLIGIVRFNAGMILEKLYSSDYLDGLTQNILSMF